MIPAPWVSLVLALATYRVVRLIGWDDLPPIQRLRDRATGAQLVGNVNGPSEWRYRRPLLAHFLHCAYCQGFWTGLVVYLAWLGEPSWTLYAAAPFALNGFVGIVARRLDP